MPAGRPKKADPGALYVFAHQFYWDFRHLLEGAYRSKLDEKLYAELLAQSEKVVTSKEQETHAKVFVREEIEEGRARKDQWRRRLAEVRQTQLDATRSLARFRAAEEATTRIRVPGEPEVVQHLLEAQTADDVRKICEDASVQIRFMDKHGETRHVDVPNWPVAPGSVLPMYLSQHAASFIAAKNDPRFPRSERPTTLLKQLWFLSRALAGAVHNVEPRTAVNLVGSRRPEESFEESHAATPTRKRPKKGSTKSSKIRGTTS